MESNKNIRISDNNIESLFLENLDIMHIIVNDYINNGMFSRNEKQDVIQTIHEELLKNKKKIVGHFKGNSSFRTYLYVIIRNICLHIERDKKKILKFDTQLNEIEAVFYPVDNIIIEQEFERLDKCLELFIHQRIKLEFCLKLKFRIPFSKPEFYRLFPFAEKHIYETSFQDVNKYHKLTDNFLFKEAAMLLEFGKKKPIATNSLIKWTKVKINDLIRLMNGEPKRANYSEETLQILIEKYFYKQDKVHENIPEHKVYL